MRGVGISSWLLLSALALTPAGNAATITKTSSDFSPFQVSASDLLETDLASVSTTGVFSDR